MEHLIGQGHRMIAIINGPSDVATSQDRYRAYHDTLTLHGLPVNSNLIHHSHFFRNSDLSDTIKLMMELPISERPTAMFATSNFIGLNIVKSLKNII